MDSYYAFYSEQQKWPSSRGQRIDAAVAPRQEIMSFPPLDTDAGYKIGLGGKALTHYYITRHGPWEEYMDAGLGDHTFNIMNHVTAADGDKVYEAVFDMMHDFFRSLC